MAATPGWRFSVTIPSWTQTALEGDELVVVSALHCAHESSSIDLTVLSMHAMQLPVAHAACGTAPLHPPLFSPRDIHTQERILSCEHNSQL